MKLLKRLVSAVIALGLYAGAVAADTNPESVRALLNRIGGTGAADNFVTVVDETLATNGKETFVITSDQGKPCIKGSTLSALTTGIGWYLNHYANVNLTWNCPKVDLASVNLPVPASEERHSSDAVYRYYLNYCTFSYSMSTWTWDRWQEEIDWMALRGINMPLQIVGLEEVWRKFLMEDYKYTQAEVDNYVAGPCYMAWFGMNNLEGWGGQYPTNTKPSWWYTRQAQLGRQICDRMRSLGIEPVLPGFCQLPSNFSSKSGINFKTAATGSWCGFSRPHLADPSDPNYDAVAAKFYARVHEVLGKSKYYSMDPFHEGGGASNVSSVANVYAKCYEAMNTASPGSKWVIQSWQWDGNQRQSLTNVPVGKLIVLDLFSDGNPAWSSYGNQDVVFSTIFNFGGRSGYFGRVQTVIDGYWNAKTSKSTVKGIGAAPEAIEQTPVAYDLLFELPWYSSKPDAEKWFADYSTRRYGQENEQAAEAWELIRTSALNRQGSGQGPHESLMCARPNLDGNKVSTWGFNELYYDPNMVIEAAYKLLDSDLSGENFSFDLTDFSRQALSDYVRKLLPELKAANTAGNTARFNILRDAYLQLFLDIDDLLNTNSEFMLGHWTERARKMADEVSGSTTADRDWLELNNARQLITTWGQSGQADNPGKLRDYSYRQWGGMMKDYYYARWKYWFDNNMTAPSGGWFQWEWNWAHSNPGIYPDEPIGDSREVAARVMPKYLTPFESNIAGAGRIFVPRMLTTSQAGKFFDSASRGVDYTPNLNAVGATIAEFAIDFNNNGLFDADETITDADSYLIPENAAVGERKVKLTLSDGTVVIYTLRIFEEITEDRTVSVATADETQGSVSIDGTDAKSITNKEVVVVRATPTQKYDFAHWTDASGNVVGNDNPMSYYGKEPAQFTAHFVDNKWGIPGYFGTNFPPADMITYGQYLVSLGVTQGGKTTTFFESTAEPEEPFYYVTNRIKAAPGGAFHFDYQGKGDLRYNFLSAYCDLNSDGVFDINSNELLGTKGTYWEANTSVGQGGFDVLLPYDTPTGTTHIRLRFDGAWLDKDVKGAWDSVNNAFKPDVATNRVIYEVLLEINDAVEYATTVTVKSNNELYGTVRSENAATNVYNPGDKVILTAFPEPGFRLAKWVDNHGRELPRSWMQENVIEFTAFDNAEITAVFERIPVEIDLWQLELESDDNGLTYISRVVTEGESHLDLSADHSEYGSLIDYIEPGVFSGCTALRELTLPDQELTMTGENDFYNSGTHNGQASKIQIEMTLPNGSAASLNDPYVKYEDPFRMTISGTYKGTSFNNDGCILFANGTDGTGSSFTGGWSKILLRKNGSVAVWWDSATPVEFPITITSDFSIKIDYLGNKQTRFVVSNGEGDRVEKIISNSSQMKQIWHYAVYIPAGMTETIRFSHLETITQVPGEALAGCRNLMDIHVSENCSYAVEKKGVIYDKTGKNCIAYPEGRILGGAFSLKTGNGTNELTAAPVKNGDDYTNLAVSATTNTASWNTIWTIDQEGSLIHYNSGLGVDNTGKALSKEDAVFSYAIVYDEGEPSISFTNSDGWYMTANGMMSSPFLFDFYPIYELTVPAGNLRTVTFPVNVVVPDDAEVFSLDKISADGGYISHIMPGHIIPAGTGVLVVGDVAPFAITNQASFESPDLLDGTTVALVMDTPYYILEGENFVRKASGTIPANTGYVPAGVYDMASFPYKVPGYAPVEIDGWKFDWRYSYDESVICLTAAVEEGNGKLDLSQLAGGNDRIIDIDPAMFVNHKGLTEVTLPDSRLGQHYYNSSLQGAGVQNALIELPQPVTGNTPWNLTIEGSTDGSSFNQWGSGLFATGTNALASNYVGGFQLYLSKAGQLKVLFNDSNNPTDHSVAFDQVTVSGDFTIVFNHTVDKNAGNYMTRITVTSNGKSQSKTFNGKLSPINSFCSTIPEGVNINHLHLEGADFLFPYTEGELFAGCSNIQAFHVSENCEYAVEKDGVLYDKQNPGKCIAYPEGRLYSRPFAMTCADNVTVCADPIIDGDGMTSTDVTVQNVSNPINSLWILAQDNCLNHLNSGIHMNANGSGVGENHNEYICSLIYGDEEPQLSFRLDEERYLGHTEGVLLVESEPHLFRFTPVSSFTATAEEDVAHAVSFPLDVVVPQGANVKGVSEVDGVFGGTIFDIPAGTVIPAGQPVVTVGGESEFAFAPAQENAAAAREANVNLLRGNVVATNSSAPFYLLENGQFVRHDFGVIPANSCYLPATEELTTDAFPFENISEQFEIVLTPSSLVMIEGETTSLEASVKDAPSYAVVTLTSEDESIVTVDEDGVVTAVGVGETSIIATCGRASTICDVSVNPAPEFYITPQTVSIRTGETYQLRTVKNNLEHESATVTWRSTNTKVATVDANGLVTSLAEGTTTIIATCDGNQSAATVTVLAPLKPAISITTPTVSLNVGGTKKLEVKLTDMGKDPVVTWTSSDEEVATVDSTGKVAAVGVGEATITAECNGIEATATVTVTRVLVPTITVAPTSLELTAGETGQLTATIVDMPEGATVAWNSANTRVATVDATGLVKAVAEGTTTINAVCNGKRASATVIVNRQLVPAISVTPASYELTAGESVDLTADLTDMPAGTTVNWTSSNEAVATVSANGHVEAKAEGDAIITATAAGLSATAEIHVNRRLVPAISLDTDVVLLTEGETATVTATLTDMPAEAVVEWLSTDTSVATVDAQGVITAVAAGETTVVASCNGVEASVSVKVERKLVPALTLSPEAVDLVEGDELQLEATPIDMGEDVFITWTSSAPAVATVSEAGKVTAIAEGEATITATCGGLSATCLVKVSAKSTVDPNPGEDGIDSVNAGADDEYYSISGLRLNKRNAKGFHIHNGKKVFKKG